MRRPLHGLSVSHQNLWANRCNTREQANRQLWTLKVHTITQIQKPCTVCTSSQTDSTEQLPSSLVSVAKSCQFLLQYWFKNASFLNINSDRRKNLSLKAYNISITNYAESLKWFWVNGFILLVSQRATVDPNLSCFANSHRYN